MKFYLRTLILLCIFVSTGWADQIKLLDQNKEAFSNRVQLIQSAKSEILVEYFLTHKDPYTLLWFTLFKQAAERNVKVKIMIDDLHNGLSQAQLAALLGVSKNSTGNKNIEIKVFNSLKLLKAMYLTYRNHDKLLLVDADSMIIGGRNPSYQYYGQSSKQDNFKDADALVIGSSAQVARKYFMDLWHKNRDVQSLDLGNYSCQSLNQRCGDDDSLCEMNKSDYSYKIAQADKDIQSKVNPLLASLTPVDITQNLEEVGPIQFISNDPLQVMKNISENQKISAQIMSLLEKAKEKILILTPYFYPTEEQLMIFKKTIARGVKITVVTNSLNSTNQMIVHAAFESIKKRLVSMGLTVLMYKGLPRAEILHAKGFLIDDEIAFIGSFNFDRRSALLNREIGIITGPHPITGSASQFTQNFAHYINQDIIQNSVVAIDQGIEYDLTQFESVVPEQKKLKLEENKKSVILHYFPDHI